MTSNSNHIDRYMAAYQDMIHKTAAPHAPWWVIPADKKWFARLVVAGALIDAMQQRDLHFPKVEGAALKELEKVRKALEAEAPKKGKRS